jgi:hypothetical protein
MKIKIERFWNEDIKEVLRDINDSLKQMEIEAVRLRLNKLFEVIQSDLESKIRVTLCFALEKIAQFDPFYNSIIKFFMKLLIDEQDSHVKEFAVYILGNLVLEKPNLALITRTLPIFVKFCEDSSEHVRASAEDIKTRLDHVKETKIKEKEIITSLLKNLKEFIDKKIDDLNTRANEISKQALSLDYEAAFNNQDRMVEDIHNFSDLNENYESEIKTFIRNQVDEKPIFEGEFQEELLRWKNLRAQKEDLIRQVHCIIRIQSKIFKIIQYIKSRGNKEQISIDQLKLQTEGGLRGIWSDDEIIDTLEKLVQEEIVPNLFLQQVKDLKDLMELPTEDEK